MEGAVCNPGERSGQHDLCQSVATAFVKKSKTFRKCKVCQTGTATETCCGHPGWNDIRAAASGRIDHQSCAGFVEHHTINRLIHRICSIYAHIHQAGAINKRVLVQKGHAGRNVYLRQCSSGKCAGADICNAVWDRYVRQAGTGGKYCCIELRDTIGNLNLPQSGPKERIAADLAQALWKGNGLKGVAEFKSIITDRGQPLRQIYGSDGTHPIESMIPDGNYRIAVKTRWDADIASISGITRNFAGFISFAQRSIVEIASGFCCCWQIKENYQTKHYRCKESCSFIPDIHDVPSFTNLPSRSIQLSSVISLSSSSIDAIVSLILTR